jgi:hypothetical protein
MDVAAMMEVCSNGGHVGDHWGTIGDRLMVAGQLRARRTPHTTTKADAAQHPRFSRPGGFERSRVMFACSHVLVATMACCSTR